MKILFVLQRYPGYGGIENVTKILCEHFISVFKWNVTIFSTSFQSVESQVINSPLFELINTNLKGKQLKIYFDEIIQKVKPDIIIYQDSYIPEYFLLTNLPKNIKIIVCEHNTPDCLEIGLKSVVNNLPNNSFRNIIRKVILPFKSWKLHKQVTRHHRELFSLSDKYVTLSPGFIPILQNHYKLDSAKLAVIPNPISIPRLDASENKEDIALFVGRLTQQKGLGYLLDIWERVQSVCDWKLLIVGDGDEKDWIKQQIKERRLYNVELLGFREDVGQFYRRAKIHLMTSVYEGFGLTNIEASSYGTVPFLFNSFASASDLIHSGENGFLIAPFDIEAYSESIIKFISLPEKDRIRISNNAKRNSCRYSPDLIVSQWHKLFTNL